MSAEERQRAISHIVEYAESLSRDVNMDDLNHFSDDFILTVIERIGEV
jgi:hypothetical protein